MRKQNNFQLIPDLKDGVSLRDNMNEPTQKYFSIIRVGNREFDIAYIKSLIYVTSITPFKE